MFYFVSNNSIEYGGGVERVVYNFITNFKHISRSEIKLVCNVAGKPKSFVADGFQCANLFRNSSVSLFINSSIGKVFLLRQLIYSYRVYKYLSFAVKEGDTVVVHGIEYAFFLSLLRKFIKKDFIFIIHLHGTEFLGHSEYINNLPLRFFMAKSFFYFFRWYYFVLDKSSLSGADGFIYLTKNLENYVSAVYKIKKRGIIVNNGFYPSGKNIQRTRGGIFTGLIVGSSPLGKGLDIAIESVRRVQNTGLNIHLNVVGFSKFSPSALPEYIHYVGPVPPADMGEWYEKSDFLLLPSRNEGFPLTVLEALQYNLPFVVSVVCRTLEIEGAKDYGYIVNSYNPARWAEAISRISDGKIYSEMVNSISNNKRTLYNYSWQLLADKYEGFLTSRALSKL